MKCTFCGNQLTIDMLREKGCGACLGGCRKIHCPYCGQENPVIPELLEKFIKDDRSATKKGRAE
jgi:hypothetical protein